MQCFTKAFKKSIFCILTSYELLDYPSKHKMVIFSSI